MTQCQLAPYYPDSVCDSDVVSRRPDKKTTKTVLACDGHWYKFLGKRKPKTVA
jgi:hypothetical protein